MKYAFNKFGWNCTGIMYLIIHMPLGRLNLACHHWIYLSAFTYMHNNHDIVKNQSVNYLHDNNHNDNCNMKL
jgi:hypothetical protein